MGRSYSIDLRQRVVARVAGGQSRRGAAEDLAALDPAPQGRPAGTGKLDPYRAFLIERVKEKPDITMPELAAELAARHGVEVDPASLSRFLCKVGLSYKKNFAGQRARSL